MMGLRPSLLLLLLCMASVSVHGFTNSGPLNRRPAFAAPPLRMSEAVVSKMQDESASSSSAAEMADEGAMETKMEEGSPVVVAAAETKPVTDDDRKIKINRERHTVFIGNLPFDTTEDELKELCGAHGTVQLVSLPRRKDTGEGRGFAFVDMGSEQDVEAVVEQLNLSSFSSRTLNVSKSISKDKLPKKEGSPRDNPQLPATPIGFKKLYVGNLPFDSTLEDITAFFDGYGKVHEVFVPKNSDGSGRGFAFVTLEEDGANRALLNLMGSDLRGRTVFISEPLERGQKATARQRRTEQTKIYVGNLSFYTVPETLEEVFGEFGQVLDCYLPEDRMTGGSRGFGFVTMSKQDAVAAIEALDGCEVDGRNIRVNEAAAKGQREAPKEEDDGDAYYDD